MLLVVTLFVVQYDTHVEDILSVAFVRNSSSMTTISPYVHALSSRCPAGWAHTPFPFVRPRDRLALHVRLLLRIIMFFPYENDERNAENHFVSLSNEKKSKEEINLRGNSQNDHFLTFFKKAPKIKNLELK